MYRKFSKTLWNWSFLKRRFYALTSHMQSTAWTRAKRHVKMDLSPDELTPTEEYLIGVIAELGEQIEQLKDEQRRAKGETTRPKIKASQLNQPSPDGKRGKGKRQSKSKGKGKKRPGSAKRHKTSSLEIDVTVPLHPENLPPGSYLVDYQDVVVQDLEIRRRNVKYRRARYKLADGSFVTAPLPSDVDGHFGTSLRCHVLYQYFQNHVTQPLIYEELCELGVDISIGQVNRLVTEGHDAFHEEKDGLLPAGLAVSSYIHTDDTLARHQGSNGYATHIGNELFASFTSTDSKSRVNFFQILLAPAPEYTLNLDALYYMECHGLSESVRLRFEPAAEAWTVFSDKTAWDEWIEEQGVTARQQRIVTEAALWTTLLHCNVLDDIVIISDDAPQFKIFGFLNGLCWVHAERRVNRLVPLNRRQRKDQDRVQDEIWTFYQELKAYRQSPGVRRRKRLEREFDRIFTQSTEWSQLNDALGAILAKRKYLLLVLDHPEIPLHNNLSENDIREYVKKRHISAGTRSDLGRRCRDTFLSLKKTCRKLGISFWSYLRDRVGKLHEIPPLSDLIHAAAEAT